MKGVFGVLTICFLAGKAYSASLYSAADLGTLGGFSSEGFSINVHGQVAGWSNPSSGLSHGFFWDSAGGMRDIGTLGGSETDARGINDAGQVVGWSDLSSGVRHGFRWSASGGMQNLGSFGGAGASSNAHAIGNDGIAVGESGFVMDGSNYNAALWDSLNTMQDLGTLGTPGAAARGINDTGQVVGWSFTVEHGPLHAFLWDIENGMEDLGTLGGPSSNAWGINNNGQVVGNANIANNERHAFIWDAISGMRDIGTLGNTYSNALGINDRGQIVGSSTPASGGTTHAVLWDTTGGIVDLNHFVDLEEGWFLFEAQSINLSGQIVANAYNANRDSRTYVLTPIPIPASAWLFGSALGILGWIRRGRS